MSLLLPTISLGLIFSSSCEFHELPNICFPLMYLFQQHGDWSGLLPRYWYILWSEKSCDPFCYCPCGSGDGKENRPYTKPISITDMHLQPFGLDSFKSNWLYGDNLRTAECSKHTNTPKVFLDEEINLSVLTCLLSGPRVEVTAAFKDAALTQTGGFPQGGDIKENLSAFPPTLDSSTRHPCGAARRQLNSHHAETSAY